MHNATFCYITVTLQYMNPMFHFMFVQVCRVVDKFITDVAAACPRNKNVELGGRDGFKLFQYGVTGYIWGLRRIDGGWHIAIARHLHLFMCTSDILTLPKKKQ